MKKRILLIAGLTGIMMLAGCATEIPAENGSAELSEEITSEITEETDSEAEQVGSAEDSSSDSEEVAETEGDSSQEADAYKVDLKDFSDQMTLEYNGFLEENLADALGTTVVTDDEKSVAGMFRTICDGAIEISGTANGTGFYVRQKQKVDNFSIFGVTLGMSEDEADKTLIDQGLKKNTGDMTYYAINPDDYYVYFTAEGGTVTEINYVKCYDRGE